MNMLMAIVALIIYTPDTIPVDVGTYRVNVDYDDGKVDLDTSIKVNVIDETTVISQSILLDANDFYITDINDVDEELIIRLSNLKIWNQNTLEEYAPSNVVYSKVNENKYLVSLHYNDNVFVNVNMFLVGRDEYREVVLPSNYSEYYLGEDEYSRNFYFKYQYIVIAFLLIIYILIYFVFRQSNIFMSGFAKNISAYMDFKKLSGE